MVRKEQLGLGCISFWRFDQSSCRPNVTHAYSPRLSVLCPAVYLAFVLLMMPPTVKDASADQQIPIRVSNLPNANSAIPTEIARQRVLDRFLELNPDVRVVPAQGIQIETLASEVTTIMMVAGDISPDVLDMNFRSMDTFVRQGIVISLDEMVSQAEADGIDVLGRILPRVRDVVYRPWPGDERRLYGLPDQLMVMGLYYNRELFRRAGLPPRAPQDWDELADFARRISDLGSEYTGLQLTGGQGASWYLMNFIWSAGGEAVQEISPGEWRAAFNSREAGEAFAFYYRLVEIERVARRTGGVSTDQDRARVGMFFHYVGDAIEFNPDEFAFGAVPKGPTGLRGSEVNARVLGISSQIRDPAIRDAAWRYILFVTGPEAEQIRTQTLVDLGQAAQVNPIMLRRYGFHEYLSLVPKGVEEELEEAIKHGKPEPYGKNCNLVYLEMNYPLDQILLSASIRTAWEAGDIPLVMEETQRILDQAVGQTNERMIGYVAPEDLRTRRIVAMVVLGLIATVFTWVVWYVSRIFSQSTTLISRPVSALLGYAFFRLAVSFSSGITSPWPGAPLWPFRITSFFWIPNLWGSTISPMRCSIRGSGMRCLRHSTSPPTRSRLDLSHL